MATKAQLRTIDHILTSIVERAEHVAGLRQLKREQEVRCRVPRLISPRYVCAAGGASSSFCPSPAGDVCIAATAAANQLLVMPMGEGPGLWGTSAQLPCSKLVAALDVAAVVAAGQSVMGQQTVVATAAGDGSLQLLGVSSSAEVAGGSAHQLFRDTGPSTDPPPSQGASCTGLQFIPDARHLAALSSNGAVTVHAWQQQRSQQKNLVPVLQIAAPHNATKQQLEPGIHWLASTGSSRKGLYVWWRHSTMLRRYSCGSTSPAGASTPASPSAAEAEWMLPHPIACVRSMQATSCSAALAIGMADGTVVLFDKLQGGFLAALPRLPSPPTHLLILGGAADKSRHLVATTRAGELCCIKCDPHQHANAAQAWQRLSLPLLLLHVRGLIRLPGQASHGKVLVLAAATQPAAVISGLPDWTQIPTSSASDSSRPRLLVIDTAGGGGMCAELQPSPGMTLWNQRQPSSWAARGSILLVGAQESGCGDGNTSSAPSADQPSTASGPAQLVVFDLAAVSQSVFSTPAQHQQAASLAARTTAASIISTAPTNQAFSNIAVVASAQRCSDAAGGRISDGPHRQQ